MQRRLPEPVAGLIFCIATLFITPAAPAAGQTPPPEAAPEAAVQTVAVTDSRDPVWKSYRKMLKGMDAFDRLHRLAPTAALKFVIRPQQENLPMTGMQMRIVGDHTDLLLPIADDNTFELPRNAAAAADDAELRLNRSQKLYRFRADIRTPAIAPDARRLGDLRLECEVRWAIDKFDMSFVSAAYLGLQGGACHSSSSRIWHSMPQNFSGVTLTHGERREQLAAERLDPANHHRYAPPLQDESWPDDTIITFQTEALP